MKIKYIVLLISSFVSIILFVLKNIEYPVFYAFIYGLVVVTIFLVVSTPVSLLSDTLTENLKSTRWIVSCIFQIIVTFLVLTPFLFIPLFLLFSHQNDKIDLASFIEYSGPFWKYALFNSFLFWLSDEIVRLIRPQKTGNNIEINK